MAEDVKARDNVPGQIKGAMHDAQQDQLNRILEHGACLKNDNKLYDLARTVIDLVVWLSENKRHPAKLSAMNSITTWSQYIKKNVGANTETAFDSESNVTDKCKLHLLFVKTLIRWEMEKDKSSDLWADFYTEALRCAVKSLNNVCMMHVPDHFSSLDWLEASSEQMWDCFLYALQHETPKRFGHCLWYLLTQQYSRAIPGVYAAAEVQRHYKTGEVYFGPLYDKIRASLTSEDAANRMEEHACHNLIMRVDDVLRMFFYHADRCIHANGVHVLGYRVKQVCLSPPMQRTRRMSAVSPDEVE